MMSGVDSKLGGSVGGTPPGDGLDDVSQTAALPLPNWRDTSTCRSGGVCPG